MLCTTARAPRPAPLRGCGVPIPLPRAGDVVCGGLPPRAALAPRAAVPALRAAARRRGTRARPQRQAFDAAWAPVALRGRRARPRRRAEVPPRPPAGRRHGGAPRRGHAAALLAGATIVPVPAHPAHARGRGYDQAGLLAGALARRTARRSPRPLRRRGPVPQPARRVARGAPGAAAHRRLRAWHEPPARVRARRRRAHDRRHARRVRPSAARAGAVEVVARDLGARSRVDPCQTPSVPR